MCIKKFQSVFEHKSGQNYPIGSDKIGHYPVVGNQWYTMISHDRMSSDSEKNYAGSDRFSI